MNNRKIERFLDLLTNNLLYVYVISMVIVAIIYIINPVAQYHIVESPYITDENFTVGGELVTKTISYGEAKELERIAYTRALLTISCICGILICNPVKRERLKKLWSIIRK